MARVAGMLFITLVAAMAVPSADARAATYPDRSVAGSARPARDLWVARGRYRIFVREYAGRGPALVLLHGFPDNLHLYDALVPHLRGRRVVTFDFLGWGRSDKPQRHRYTFAAQEADLDAVIEGLGLQRVELVAHDAGVPSAANWALDHPQRTASLTIMNGFYAPTPTLRPPPLIALLQLAHLPPGFTLGALPPDFTGSLGALGREITSVPAVFRRVFVWQERRFFSRRRDANRYIPLFARQFAGRRSSLRPLRSLAADAISAVGADAGRVPELAAAPFPVHLVWGARDPDLNVQSAEDLRDSLPHASLGVLPGAHHNLQIDEPVALARFLEGEADS